MTNLANSCNEKHKGLVPKETVLLRRWGVETNDWFINRVDKGELATVKRFEC